MSNLFCCLSKSDSVIKFLCCLFVIKCIYFFADCGMTNTLQSTAFLIIIIKLPFRSHHLYEQSEKKINYEPGSLIIEVYP